MRILIPSLVVLGWFLSPVASSTSNTSTPASSDHRAYGSTRAPNDDDSKTIESFVQAHCIDCHNESDKSGTLDLESLEFSNKALQDPKFDSKHWESMLRRINSRQMPPADSPKPSEAEYTAASQAMSRVLDQRAKAFPKPGRPQALRRLTRTEYRNAIRDLVGLEIDVDQLLPKDQSSHGFDNITVGELSPTRLNRYLKAAELISKTAIGTNLVAPEGVTVRVPADLTQEDHIAGLPLGTRGGTLIKHHFPVSGNYKFAIRLQRDRDEMIEGLHHEHKIDVLIDRNRFHQFSVKPPANRKDHTLVDANLTTTIAVSAGSHDVGITFPRTFASLMETKRQPFDARFNRHRHPRRTPAIFQVSIVGPVDNENTNEMKRLRSSNTARRKIFTDYPVNKQEELKTAKKIISRLARRAYRRPVTEADLESPMGFYQQAAKESGFEAGIEMALTSILINPNFLFHIESEPADDVSQSVYPISDFELASRLSFFLWSSLPDEELLQIAEAGELSNEVALKKQVRRMLSDKRSGSLVNNFASQWLYLRNLKSITPDLRLFPDFDDNLRSAFQRETEHLFANVIKNDESVLNLIDSDFTFLNQRLAKHYGIPGVVGSHFRKVNVDDKSNRGGILRHGSILTVTSYATRTSPTIRGAWILENIFGTPPPPPPANVPSLEEKTALVSTSVRERLAMHRADPACASCHNLMDPVGFALENFDALGRWRDYEETNSIDSTGRMPDGFELKRVGDLEAAIMKRPEMFVGTITEKLMVFALGRGLEPFDGPAVRRIVGAAKDEGFRFSSIIEGLVLSQPFRYRSIDTD